MNIRHAWLFRAMCRQPLRTLVPEPVYYWLLDRFRDNLADVLGHPDSNPGDDALIAELRQHFGRTGPEPTRWRDFLTGTRARLDQIEAMADPLIIWDGEL